MGGAWSSYPGQLLFEEWRGIVYYFPTYGWMSRAWAMKQITSP